jgi:hypothetical protein
VPDRTVYLLDELWLDGDRVACRYAVAFVTSRSDRSEWHAIVYDPAEAGLARPGKTLRFSALSRDGARLGGRVSGGRAEASVGADYLAGVGPLTVRGQDRRPVVLGPAEQAARELAGSAFIGGRLYPLHEEDQPAAGGRPTRAGGRLAATFSQAGLSTTSARAALVALCALAVWGAVAAGFDVWRLVRDDDGGPTASATAAEVSAATTCVAATSVLIDGRAVPLRSALMILERPAAADAHWTFVLFEPDAAVVRSLDEHVQVRVTVAGGLAYSGPARVDCAGPGYAYMRLTTADTATAAGAAALTPLR